MSRTAVGSLGVAVLAVLAAAPVGAQDRGHSPPAGDSAGAVPLYTDLGTLHHPVTTRSARAQQYFDQGLRLAYGFNHDEALRSFTEAARLDPGCAMCFWGIAYVLGPNINLPMDPAQARPAYAAVRRALGLAPRASRRDRAYIRALAARYAADSAAERARLDSAYARAARRLAQRYPDDPDAVTLYAEALMLLRPWDYWTGDGRPQPGTPGLVAVLERAVARHPEHPGACHFYIHAVEASTDPGRALPCAERLARLMPGAGHLVHMPAHIYMRVGRYDLAVEHNRHAVSVDHRFIADRHPVGAYLVYYAHNHHFLWAALTMQGRSAEAIRAARDAVASLPAELFRQAPSLEYLTPTPYFALARFARWDDLLREPPPAAELRYGTAMWRYARGLALAATGRTDSAAVARDSVAAAARAMPAEAVVGLNSARTLLEIAERHLAAEVAVARGDTSGAIEALEQGIRLEDGLRYDEPPAWYFPLREPLGRLLLAAGQPARAEAAFREQLVRYPENGWGLYGLAKSLRRQKRDGEAAQVEERYRKAWSAADVRVPPP